MSQNARPRFLIFDIESIADGDLVSQVKYPKDHHTPQEAITLFRAERYAEKKSDFVPYTFQLPISIVVAKVDAEFNLLDLKSLDEPEFRPHVMTKHFWTGWERYGQPTLVTFNGRQFDIPLLELAAFRFGISIPKWFRGEKSSNRNRYNQGSHLDLQELLTNFGATYFAGGLNLAANSLGKPGKMDVQGCMVQDLYDQNNLQEISDYCRCDVLDTYFVFLRCMVLTGELTLDREQELVNQTRQWLEDRAEECKVYRHYLGNWGIWRNPWQSETPLPPDEE
jgi:3'-5' exonuclease